VMVQMQQNRMAEGLHAAGKRGGGWHGACDGGCACGLVFLLAA
jgi:hypothetical protein